MERVLVSGHGGHDHEPVTPEQRWMEALMMGLRLREGGAACAIGVRIRKIHRRDFEPAQIEGAVGRGLITLPGDSINPPARGCSA